MKDAALGAAFVTMALVLVPRASAAQQEGNGGARDDAAEAVWLVYEDKPPPDCPSEDAFQAEVTKLTSKARFTTDPHARRIHIELNAGRSGGVVGKLISGDGKYQSSRVVRGKDCQEVSSALAIAVALTIDPGALLGPEPEPEPKPPTPPEPKPEPKPKEAPTPKPKAPPKPLPLPPPPPPQKLYWGVGAGLELENTWAPGMHAGGHVFGVFGAGDRFRASLGIARFVTHQVDKVDFGAWLVDGSATVNFAVLGVLRPFAGLGYEFGTVDSVGSGLPQPVQAQRPWQAGSVGLGLRFETDSVFLQLGGWLLVPISRQRYLVSDPNGEIRTLFDVPSMGLRQETALGVFL